MGLYDFFKKKESGDELVLTDYSDQIQQVYTDASEISLKLLKTQLSDKEIFDLYKGIPIVVPIYKISNGYDNDICLSYNKKLATLTHSKPVSV